MRWGTGEQEGKKEGIKGGGGGEKDEKSVLKRSSRRKERPRTKCVSPASLELAAIASSPLRLERRKLN